LQEGAQVHTQPAQSGNQTNNPAGGQSPKLGQTKTGS